MVGAPTGCAGTGGAELGRVDGSTTESQAEAEALALLLLLSYSTCEEDETWQLLWKGCRGDQMS